MESIKLNLQVRWVSRQLRKTDSSNQHTSNSRGDLGACGGFWGLPETDPIDSRGLCLAI